jgi:hypothetical protein
VACNRLYSEPGVARRQTPDMVWDHAKSFGVPFAIGVTEEMVSILSAICYIFYSRNVSSLVQAQESVYGR